MSSSTELFSLLNGWDVPHTDRHISTTTGTVHLIDLHLSLPYDINSFALSKYSRQHIRDRTLGYISSPIRLPFLAKQTALDNEKSVDIFQMILQYISENGLSEDKRRLLGSFIIQNGLTASSLRDEIYIQLCNQTMAGDTKKYDQQLTRAWHLLALCLCTFPPSKDLSKYLLKYVSDSKTSSEYNVVCQQKLLQCVEIEPRLSRVYPPTLLEWETVKRKACMALTANFCDGEKVYGHVESWTTGETFASRLLQSRGYGSSLSGWTVTLRDDGDLYECAGYDYVLDFIGEIEVPPMFPCNSAYYLTTRGVTKSNRPHYNDQPHTADRPRLMPLEVNELPESLINADIGTSRPAVVIPPPRPRTPTPPPSPVVSIPPVVSPIQSPRKPPTPAPSVKIEPPKKSDNIYAANNEAMSQQSALNRRDKLPENLSTTSALNNRYSQAAGQQPPAVPPERPRSPVIIRTKSEVRPPRNAFSYHQPLPEPTRNPRDPLRLRAAVDPNQSEEANLDFMMDAWFSDIDGGLNAMTDPVMMQGKIKGGGEDVQTVQNQSPVDLETQLKTTLLEAEVLRKSIEVEKYKKELEILKQVGKPQINGSAPDNVAHPKQPPPTKPKSTTAAAANNNVAPMGNHAAVVAAAAAARNTTKPPAASYLISPPPPLTNQAHNTAVRMADVETVEQIQNGINDKPAEDVEKAKSEVVKATPAGGIYNKTPKKIGQIRWPPSNEKEVIEEPKAAPGKLVIDEQIEESLIIVAKQSPEEIQRKIAEKIAAAKMQHEQQEAMKLAEKSSRKNSRRVAAPVAAAAGVAVVAASRDGNSSDESEYDDTVSANDMRARQMALEKQLIKSEWGSVHRKDRVVPVIPIPPPPPNNVSEPLPLSIEPPPEIRKVEIEKAFDIHSMDNMHTVLYAQIAEPFYTYTKVSWIFEVRKEVFSPMEQLDNPSLINLVFTQIVHDVFANESVRLGKDDRTRINQMLDKNGINARNVTSPNHRQEMKLDVINATKEAPYYFCRMYPVNGGSKHVNLHLLGVNHSGVRLITRYKDVHEDYLSTIEHIQFNELLDISVAKPSTILIRLARKSIVVYSYMAPNIVAFIRSYKEEAEKSKWLQR